MRSSLCYRLQIAVEQSKKQLASWARETISLKTNRLSSVRTKKLQKRHRLTFKAGAIQRLVEGNFLLPY